MFPRGVEGVRADARGALGRGGGVGVNSYDGGFGVGGETNFEIFNLVDGDGVSAGFVGGVDV